MSGTGEAGATPAWLTRMLRPFRAHPFVTDWLLVVVLELALGITSVTSVGTVGWLGVAMVASLAWRRVRPVVPVVVCLVLGLVQIRVSNQLLGGDLAALVALYSATRHSDARWLRFAALGCGLIGAVAAAARIFGTSLRDGIGSFIGIAALVLMIWLLADRMRNRSLVLQSLRDRADAAERERDQQARLAVADERARIARDLHDVVAHSLSLMTVQADGASYVAERDPVRARQALTTIADTGRRTLGEMRAILGVLRGDDTGEADSDDDRTPQPDVSRLPELVESVRGAGLGVSMSVTGTRHELGSVAGMTAYRIVQESLTNVIKHAGPNATVDVAMAWADDALAITVRDDGRGGLPQPGGHGLVGMQQRVAVTGGTLRTGPAIGGGWSVQAHIPYPEDGDD